MSELKESEDLITVNYRIGMGAETLSQTEKDILEFVKFLNSGNISPTMNDICESVSKSTKVSKKSIAICICDLIKNRILLDRGFKVNDDFIETRILKK